MFFFLDEDVGEVIEALKDHMKETTRLEMAPWAKGYTTRLNELSTELTVEQMQMDTDRARRRGFKGPKVKVALSTYSDIFYVDHIEHVKEPQKTNSGIWGWFYKSNEKPESRQVVTKRLKNVKGRKILIKGKPGVGKSSLSKKIAWDWARGVFTVFSIVFLVSLRLVKPDDPIEDIILSQYSILKSLNMTRPKIQKLQYILDSKDEKVLLIVDGLDDLGSNQDIERIIKGKKLQNCCVLVTATPHCVSHISIHFEDHFAINGFTEEQSKEFISKTFFDKRKVAEIMNFSLDYSTFIQDKLYISPMLLQFICILADSNEIELSRKNVAEGEIYWRLVRCIYRKFCTQKGKSFVRGAFLSIFKKVGTLAYHGLKSKRSWFQRSEIIQEIGEEVLECGLLVSQEGTTFVDDENPHVAFPHSSMQRFLGAFGFIRSLDHEATIIDDVVSLLLNNVCFLKFCLWFITDKIMCEYIQSDDNMYHNELQMK